MSEGRWGEEALRQMAARLELVERLDRLGLVDDALKARLRPLAEAVVSEIADGVEARAFEGSLPRGQREPLHPQAGGQAAQKRDPRGELVPIPEPLKPAKPYDPEAHLAPEVPPLRGTFHAGETAQYYTVGEGDEIEGLAAALLHHRYRRIPNLHEVRQLKDRLAWDNPALNIHDLQPGDVLLTAGDERPGER